MPTASTNRAAKWYDAFSVGTVRFHVSRVNSVISWRITGTPGLLTKEQQAELVYLYWCRVRLRRCPLEAAWDYLIPRGDEWAGPLSGGVGWAGPLYGVAYVDRD